MSKGVSLLFCGIFLCHMALISHISLCKYELEYRANKNKVNK